MGINQVPIVDQYADINRRLMDIQRARQLERFTLPEGIWVLRSTSAPSVDTTQRGMYFVFRGEMLLLVRTWSSENLRSERGRALISYLRRYFPDLRHNNEDEIWLGNDIERLARGLEII